LLHERWTLSQPLKGSSAEGQKFGQQQVSVAQEQARLQGPDPMGRDVVVPKLARERSGCQDLRLRFSLRQSSLIRAVSNLTSLPRSVQPALGSLFASAVISNYYILVHVASSFCSRRGNRALDRRKH
jgi:hypothetical protein